jgi:beta-ketodecanoyl-[acyl-carrier-protein] synthase
MKNAYIKATGLFTPPNQVTNYELVSAFNAYVDLFNNENADRIAKGEISPLAHSSVEFIEKASGIKSRNVVVKDGLLDPKIMIPQMPERSNDEVSLLAEIGINAAMDCLANAGRDAKDIDCIICAASNMQRAYPAIAIEIQKEIGMRDGTFGFDMNVACSSATFAIKIAADMVKSGSVKSVLIINPEICSGHLNFKDRDSHFIFGDVATAILIESDGDFEILDTHAITQFSNNIRNNFGFLNRFSPDNIGKNDKLFVQEGRKVFKEVVPMVANLINERLNAQNIANENVRRLWLHQANAGMNRLISSRVLGHEATEDESPTILDTYANTSSAGSIIAFNKHNKDLQSGDIGVICSFGAGYSAGCVTIKKV